MSLRRCVRVGIAVTLLVLLTVPVAAAHTPTAGSAKLYGASAALPWDFPASYPGWVQTAAKAALDTNFADPATNNSKSPDFTFTAGGSGDVIYSDLAKSPCGTGNPDWLQCANGGGTTTWNIYIRNFSAAPHGSWTWYDITGSCPSGNTCWYARRALVHEILHVTLGAAHDSQGESNTVMASTTPWYNNTGWNQTFIRRCDEAASQLAYDLKDFAGPYGNCFDHISGAGSSGLKTNLTASGTSFHECNGVGIVVAGRLQVSDLDAYGVLGGNPLGSRTVWFDRGTTANYTSAVASTASTGNNWSKSFGGSNVTYTFVAHFDDATGDGLDPSNNVTFTASWSSFC